MKEDEGSSNMSLGDPQFNSGIAYLQTVSKLIENYHSAMIQKDYNLALIIADGLFDEVYPRLTKEQITRLKELHTSASNSFAANNSAFSRSKVRDYYVELNDFIHIAKMRLVDRKSLMEREAEELNGEDEVTDEELDEVSK